MAVGGAIDRDIKLEYTVPNACVIPERKSAPTQERIQLIEQENGKRAYFVSGSEPNYINVNAPMPPRQ